MHGGSSRGTHSPSSAACAAAPCSDGHSAAGAAHLAVVIDFGFAAVEHLVHLVPLPAGGQPAKVFVHSSRHPRLADELRSSWRPAGTFQQFTPRGAWDFSLLKSGFISRCAETLKGESTARRSARHFAEVSGRQNDDFINSARFGRWAEVSAQLDLDKAAVDDNEWVRADEVSTESVAAHSAAHALTL